VVERRRHHGDLGLELRQRLRVALLRQLEEDLRLVDALALLLPTVDRRGDARVLAGDVLRALRVVPEVGGRRLLAQLRGALLESSEVKDASRAR
jgi:hypothetical protein